MKNDIRVEVKEYFWSPDQFSSLVQKGRKTKRREGKGREGNKRERKRKELKRRKGKIMEEKSNSVRSDQ